MNKLLKKERKYYAEFYCYINKSTTTFCATPNQFSMENARMPLNFRISSSALEEKDAFVVQVKGHIYMAFYAILHIYFRLKSDHTNN